MKNIIVVEQSIEDLESLSTGLPFAKTWHGAYIFVLCSFVLWIVALSALTEFGS